MWGYANVIYNFPCIIHVKTNEIKRFADLKTFLIFLCLCFRLQLESAVACQSFESVNILKRKVETAKIPALYSSSCICSEVIIMANVFYMSDLFLVSLY